MQGILTSSTSPFLWATGQDGSHESLGFGVRAAPLWLCDLGQVSELSLLLVKMG